MILLISLLLILIIHELGHFIVAKLCNCQVDEFSLGFGKKIIGKQIGKTYYQIRWILIGGENRLKGELDYSNDNDAFLNLTLKKKIFITIAGLIINYIAGIITLIIGWNNGNEFLLKFGFLSLGIAILNSIPTLPCFDGSYLIYYPIILKKLGKKEGIKAIKLIVEIAIKIAIVINILCIPLLVWMIIKGMI